MPKTISTEYSRYTNEFKRLAVLLTYFPDSLSSEVADKIGIHPVMLYRWRMEMKNGDIPGKPTFDDLQSETDLLKANKKIKKLETSLKEVERERDFLKKAKRFFQGEKDKSSPS